MSRRSFPNLGADPCPGDAAGTAVLAGTYRDLSVGTGDTAARLRRVEAGEWRGAAADAFVAQAHEELLPLLERARDAFDAGRAALLGWSTTLAGLQREADALEQEAADAQSALSAARRDQDQPRVTAPEDTARVVQELAAAVDGAQGGLAAVRARATALHERYLDAAAEVAAAVERAADRALDASLWRQVADVVADGWEHTWAWVQEHADDFKAVGDVLSKISGVLAVVAIVTAPFEPVGAIAAGLALGFGAGALAAHGIAKAAGADVSWTTIGLDALGVLPGVKGALAGVKVTNRAAGSVKAAENIAGGIATKVGGSVKASDGRRFLLVGPRVHGQTVGGGTSLLARAKLAVANQNRAYGGLDGGQFVGSKGWNVVAGKLPPLRQLVVDPTDDLVRVADAHVKVATTAAGGAWQSAHPSQPRPSDPFVAGLQRASAAGR